MTKLSTGQKGEIIAEKIYKKLGHTIITKNFHTRFGEIDLITKKQNYIHVIEVKVQHKNEFGLSIEKWRRTQKRKFTTAIKLLIAKGHITCPDLIKAELITFDLRSLPKVRFTRYKNLQINI